MKPLLVFVLLVAACGGRGGPRATERFPAPFSGSGEGQTASFPLQGGDYVVDWTATDPGNGSSCFFSVNMKQDSGSGFETVVEVEPEGGETLDGKANLHDIAAGTWYFDVITHCRWTLAIHG